MAIACVTGDDELVKGSTGAIIKVNNNPTKFSWTNTGTSYGTFLYRIAYDDNIGFASPAYTEAHTQYYYSNEVTAQAFTGGNCHITGLATSTAHWYKLQFSIDGGGSYADATGSAGTFTTDAAGGATVGCTFTATPLTGTVPLIVSFYDGCTGVPVEWEWNFGTSGLTAAVVQNPTKTFNAGGDYTISLIASNAEGSSVATRTAYITMPSTAPTPGFTVGSTTNILQGGTYTCYASDTTATSWSWNVYKVRTSGGFSTRALMQSGTGSTKTFTAIGGMVPGYYDIYQIVTNSYGNSAAAYSTSALAVRIPDMVAGFTGTPLSGSAPLSVQFTPTHVSATTSRHINYIVWTFGDGATTSGTAGFLPTHQYARQGTYTVSETVYGKTTPVAGSVTTSASTRASYVTVAANPTYSAMLEELRSHLLLNSDTDLCSDFVEWGGTANILRYIYNRICRIQLEAGPLRKTSTTISATSPGVLTLPADLIEIRSIYVNGNRLERVDPRMADMDYAGTSSWQTSPAGDYKGWYTNPGDTLTLNLVPAITPSTFEVYYTYAPPEPTMPNPCSGTWDTLPFPYIYWWILKYGILADMLNHEGEMYDIERAQLCEKMFAEGIELIKLSLEGK